MSQGPPLPATAHARTPSRERARLPSQPRLQEGLAPGRRRSLEELSASFPPFICDELLPNPAMPPRPHCSPHRQRGPPRLLELGTRFCLLSSPGAVLPAPLYMTPGGDENHRRTSGNIVGCSKLAGN